MVYVVMIKYRSNLFLYNASTELIEKLIIGYINLTNEKKMKVRNIIEIGIQKL